MMMAFLSKPGHGSWLIAIFAGLLVAGTLVMLVG